MHYIAPDFPKERYSVIYCDPPWSYKNKPMIRADHHYPTMKTKEICNLPVQGITDDDCLLFMWTVSPNLDQAIIVGQAWGFKYITVGFIWHKKKTLPAFYTLPSCELCLIFKKGKIPQPRGDRTIKQFLSLKSGVHSEKPWIVRDNIVKMFPNPAHKKIELFARTCHPGWDAWGNEDGGDYHEPLIIS